jgi:hypothetical protein
MFENVQFFRIHIKNLQKALIWLKNWVYYADLKFIDAGFQKCSK